MTDPALAAGHSRAAPPAAVLVDLLMAIMNSIETWAIAAGDAQTGLAWRDAVTARMIASEQYMPYERIVAEEADAFRLGIGAVERLNGAWGLMDPWPDSAALLDLTLPYAVVTNCSNRLALEATARSGLAPRFTLSAETVGWYKPRAEAYLQSCEMMGLAPAHTLFVAGAAYDAIGAHRAGLPARLVLRRPLTVDLPPSITTAADLGSALANVP